MKKGREAATKERKSGTPDNRIDAQGMGLIIRIEGMQREFKMRPEGQRE